MEITKVQGYPPIPKTIDDQGQGLIKALYSIQSDNAQAINSLIEAVKQLDARLTAGSL